MSAAESCTQALRSTARGKLRINTPVTFGSVMLAPVLTQFLDENPEVQVELMLNDRVIDLADEGVDVGI